MKLIQVSFFIRNYFIRNNVIRNLVLDSLEFKKLLDLHGKSLETLEK